MINRESENRPKDQPSTEPESTAAIAKQAKDQSDGQSVGSSAKGIRMGNETWIDSIPQKWPRIVKKVKASKGKSSSRKKTAGQLKMGLPTTLSREAEPLFRYLEVATDTSNARRLDAIEGIVSLAESVAATFLGTSPMEFGVEVPGVSQARSLGGFSALLVANQIRDVVRHGNDQQFERAYRSLDVLRRINYDDPSGENVVLHQWLTAELPLTLGLELGEVKHFRRMAKEGIKCLSQNIREHLDSDGWPANNCLHIFPTLVASWVRSIKAARQLELKLDKTARSQAMWLGEQFVRLIGPQRMPLFDSGTYLPIDEDFARTVLKIVDDPDAWSAGKAFGLVNRKSKKKPLPEDLNDPDCVSEWASSAILKSSWKSSSPFVAVDFGKPNSRFEIGAKKLLISGTSSVTVTDDHQEVILPEDGFEVTCDIHDANVSYLEMEMEASDIKFYRQILLGRGDKFLFLADSIHKQGSGEISWSLDLPLAAGVEVMPENGTRELYLNHGGSIQSLVLPLALPEWTNQRGEGSIQASNIGDKSSISATYQATLRDEGGALYFPMFFDLSSKRSRQKRTWRKLTVAESLKVVRPETASAFRVQAGRDQWVFYRALGGIGNRTFIGQNYAGDFFVGRLKKNGEVDELLQIQ